MKKTFIAVAAILGTMTVSCTDELIDSYEDRSQHEGIIYTVPDTVLNPIESPDDVTGYDDTVKYPIGFSVTVSDYQEW